MAVRLQVRFRRQQCECPLSTLHAYRFKFDLAVRAHLDDAVAVSSDQRVDAARDEAVKGPKG
jgi:hypothetical protein